jgi:holliday junction DNA helicase RuvA
VITNISGRLLQLDNDALTLQVGAFQYQVLVPEFARRRLQSQVGQDISLHTIEYLEGSAMQGRMVPRLIGFLTEVEREFFELVCEVDGVGVKKALRAMVRPVREVAEAIEEQNIKALSALPGVGAATAERMIAKLRRKMPKFALMVAREEPRETDVQPDVMRETFEALRSLGHSESEARRLIEAALAEKQKFKTVEDLLQAIYQQRHTKSHGQRTTDN